MQTIVKSIHGSHLYGTNTESSDLDYKGVYKSSLRDIILNRSNLAISYSTKSSSSHRKNNSDDIDYVCYELRKFITDCIKGEMHCLDMLFTPPQFWLEQSEVWLDIQKNRHKLLCSDLIPLRSYINRQVGKYGVKGSRVGEIKRLREWASNHNPNKKIQDVIDTLTESDLVKVETLPDQKIPYLCILEKKLHVTMPISQLLDFLNKWLDKYGERSLQAANNHNIDYKAVSHALRGIHQCIELLETGNITFPLKSADLIKKVKQGQLHFSEIERVLEEENKRLLDCKSVIPEVVDVTFWDNWLIDVYTEYLS